MPTALLHSPPDAASVPRAAPASIPHGRDLFIDLLRVGSVALVVVMHWLTPLITVVEGQVRVEILPTGPAAWVASWFLQVMPIIFIAGGVANTAVVQRRRQSYVEYLSTRAQRLVLPVAVLVGVFAVVSSTLDAIGPKGLGSAVSSGVAKPLWFVAVYLGIVALAPLLVGAQQRFGLAVPAVLAGAAVTVDLLRFSGFEQVAVLNLGFVWLFAHQLGVAYALGALRSARPRALLALAGAAATAIVLMVTAGPYPPTMIGLRDVPVSNLAPPTAALIVLSIAQLAVIAWLSPRVRPALETSWWRRLLGLTNQHVMTVYLWHLPAMILLIGVGFVVPGLLPAPGIGWWATRPVWLLGCALLLVMLIRMWHWAETAALPMIRLAMPERFGAVLPLTGTALSVIATYDIWRHGLLLSSTQGAAAVLLLALSVALLSLAPAPHR